MFLKPDTIIKRFSLEPGIVAADFGCGSGSWGIAIAKEIGDRGKVYAVDIQKEALEAAKSVAEKEGLDNFEIVRGDIDEIKGSTLSDEVVDFVIASNVFFQIEKKDNFIEEVKRVLTSGGRAALIDWDFADTPLGPPKDLRIKEDDARRFFMEKGFIFEDNFPAGEHHYGLMFRKP